MIERTGLPVAVSRRRFAVSSRQASAQVGHVTDSQPLANLPQAGSARREEAAQQSPRVLLYFPADSFPIVPASSSASRSRRPARAATEESGYPQQKPACSGEDLSFLPPPLDPSLAILRRFREQVRAAHAARHTVIPAGHGRVDEARASHGHSESPSRVYNRYLSRAVESRPHVKPVMPRSCLPLHRSSAAAVLRLRMQWVSFAPSASRRCHTIAQPIVALGFRRPHRENERQNDPAGSSKPCGLPEPPDRIWIWPNGRSSVRRTAPRQEPAELRCVAKKRPQGAFDTVIQPATSTKRPRD